MVKNSGIFKWGRKSSKVKAESSKFKGSYPLFVTGYW